MALESWLPVGFKLPDGAKCRRPLYGDAHWQILETEGSGTALIVDRELHRKWMDLGLIDTSTLTGFQFGPTLYQAITSGPGQTIAPVSMDKSPSNRNEAIAFAMALKATREIDANSPLQDAIYVESIGRLLPTFSLSARVEDDVILGYWLTGGAQVSANSFRRLSQMLTWIAPENLKDVVAASGVSALAKERPAEETQEDEKSKSNQKSKSDAPQSEGSSLERGLPFSLPGRPELESFFNEHVIDIVRNKERYKKFGIGFPSAIVLHGPPGCGKTFAVEQLVEFLGWPSFQIDASSIASPYIHETSKKVAEVFTKAMESSPSVLVIDEMEAFLADRESGGGASTHRVEEVAEFLRRIPEAVKNEVLIVAMTNKIDMIDPAILRRGRFDHVIEVAPATEEEVLALLNKLVSSMPTDGDINNAQLAKKLGGRPLSDVAFVVREGARLAARSGSDHIKQDFLMAALEGAPSRAGEGSTRKIGFV